MSLDVYLTATVPHVVYADNITHNLNEMAGAAVLYVALWEPQNLDITKAKQLIVWLRDGLDRLKAEPERFKAFNPPNGYGNYEGLVEFVEAYLAACEAHPEAEVSVSR